MARGNQLVRQWQLLHLIDRPGGVTVEAAARELGCTVRTIWRDLTVLQRAGFPIYDDKGADGPRSIWRVAETFKAQLPLKLTLPEIGALLMSRELLAPLAAGALGAAITSAFDKIRGVLSRDALRLIDAMHRSLGVRSVGAKLQAAAADHLPLIHQALHERRRLRLRYYSMHRDEETDRAVDPYHLTYHAGGLYLVGHCHLRKDLRIFAVERIRAARLLVERYTIPADFDPVAYLNAAWGMMRGDRLPIRVAFAAELAPYIKERLWHPTQRFRALPDGRLEMSLEVADTLEVRRWILGYGAQAEVLEPAALREALRREAEALAEALTPMRRPLAVSRGGGSASRVRARGLGSKTQSS
jgi:predicted DNA-binding transcriptional regulator YafY